MIGFLKTRGPVNEEQGIDRTKAINMALLDHELRVESIDITSSGTYYFGTVPTVDYRGIESYDDYFTCSEDFQDIEYVHIYDYGEGIEEGICTITDDFKLLIIGKCLLYKAKLATTASNLRVRCTPHKRVSPSVILILKDIKGNFISVDGKIFPIEAEYSSAERCAMDGYEKLAEDIYISGNSAAIIVGYN